jgi:hypothetical protein
MPDERTTKLPIVQNVKLIHSTTGILTIGMLDSLHEAIQPVKVADYIDRQFEFLRSDVRLKDEMLEALDDDPAQWYIEHLKKLAGH